MKLKAQDVPRHSIVRFQGEWGVYTSGVLDRWHAPKIRLRPDEEVEMFLKEGRAKSYSLRLPR